MSMSMSIGATLASKFVTLKDSISGSAIGPEFNMVRDLAKKVANGQQYKGKTMERVKDGLEVALSGLALLPRVIVAGFNWVGGKIDAAAHKNPVLAMSLGLSGVLLGVALSTVEPFTGTSLIATSVYAMARGVKESYNALRLRNAGYKQPEVENADKSLESSGPAIIMTSSDDSPVDFSEPKKGA